MKPVCISFILILVTSGLLFSQQKDYYVVIGTFKKEESAKAHVNKAHALNIPAVYAVHPKTKSFYVYVRQVPDKTAANATMLSMRDEGFDRTWIYAGNLNNKILPSSSYVSTTTVSEIKSVAIQESLPVRKEISEIPEFEAEGVTPSSQNSVKEAEVISAGKPFVFRTTSQRSGETVKGMIRLQESDRATQYRAYPANEKVFVMPPVNRAGKWMAVCQIVGFKIARKQFNYKSGTNNDEEIPIVLIPVTKGDYVELESVDFFNNSNILQSTSVQQLDELVAMMEENPKYQIRVHGHTNGNQSREIIVLRENGDFFTLDPESERKEASAKELSTLRAEVIKRFLVSREIEPKRIDIRGEGGKQPIFDARSTLANGNDRVEVEITKN